MEAGGTPDDPLGAFCRENHVVRNHTDTGSLDGLTFAVKDVFHISGSRTGFGNPDWLETHPAQRQTAAAVEMLLGSGADMVGRTHSDELAYSLTGENIHYGTPVNSAAPERIPGGSSNGSAAAVAGGLVDFALGTDCGGSVRIPASYCGVLGMRPTHGRVSLRGVIPFASTFDVVGWFARDGEVLENVGRVLLGDEPAPEEPKRVLIARDAFDLVESEVAHALDNAVAGVTTEVGGAREVVLSEDGLAEWYEVFRTLQGFEIWENHGGWVTEVRPKLGPGIRDRYDWASTIPPADALSARTAHREIRRRITEMFEPGDVLCLPTSPRVAPMRNEPVDRIEVEYRVQAMHLLCVAGLGGLPQVSVPLATLDGLPLGLSLVGPPDSDTQLLALARSLMNRRDHGLGN